MSDPRPVTSADYPGSLGSRLATIEGQLGQLFTLLATQVKKKLSTGSVDVEGDITVLSGGSVTVEDGYVVVESGGGFFARYPDGQISTFFGPLFGDGRTGHGVVVARNTVDGTASVVFEAVAEEGQPGAVYVGQTGAPITEFVARADTIALQTPMTTSYATNVYMDPNGIIGRVVSSRRYKQDIADAVVDPQVVYAMRGCTWRQISEVEADPETERRYIGNIAEELHDLGGGLEQFVVYDEQGRPDAIAYDRLPVALLAAIKDLHARVTALEQGAAK